ncbi:hypothetical protein Tco_0214726 [Tanacetum coccineum]
MENLESENVYLEFQVQSLIKERENVKTEYQKLFDLIKKTRAQTQGEINELFENFKQNTYAYADVRAQNQDLLLTISELKAKLKTVENEEKHVLSKAVTLQTSPNKQQAEGTNKNVIAPGMYKVGKSQVTKTNKAKSVLSSTGLSATSTVRRPSNMDSSFNNSVVSNTKNSSKTVEVSDRTNTKPDVASKNVGLDTFVTNDEIKNALIARMYYVFLVLRITVKSTFKDTTPVVSKTRFSVRTIQSKSLDTTPVVFKAKIVTDTPLSAKNKVSSVFSVRDSSLTKYMKKKIKLQPNVGWLPVKTTQCVNNSKSTVKTSIVDSGCSKHMTGDRSLLKNFVKKFMGTVRFGNDHFAAITEYGDYVQGDIKICHVYYVEGLGHNLFSVGQFYDGDLEVAFRSKTCYVRNLEGDDLLTGDREQF